jgi:glycosyltransferase involved in cell wall biosynthesis
MNHNLSCMIITYNEEANIKRALDSLDSFSDVLVLDSGSSDKTLEIVSNYRNTRVVYRRFDTFANQCNYGLEHLENEWVLSLDADYVVTKRLREEINTILSNRFSSKENHNGYYIPFKYCINGKPIRSGLLPPRICLYRKRYARYIDVGHAHKVSINGQVGNIQSSLLHDDRKSEWVWLKNQKKYQSIEAKMLRQAVSSDLPIQDKIRKHTYLAPFIVFFMCVFIRGGIFDGKEGIIYAFQRLIAESLLYLELHGKNDLLKE